MVSRKNSIGRLAFTMIELIFAIVIISIAVLSLPMVTQITSRGVESNLVQEAIFAASAELIGATSYYWDFESMHDKDMVRLERVIDIGGTCNNTALDERYRLRPGHVNQPYHRRCLENSTINPSDASDATFPNLDNAEHASQLLFTDNTKDSTGYKESYNSAVDVTRAGDVKKITVTVTNSSGTVITALSTYSANIGEVDYFKRRF